MPEYAIHRPNFSETTTNDWEFPTQQSFETDDLSTIADHFLLSASGFADPDSFDDLELPVITPYGRLSLNALFAARHGPYSVERIEGLDGETEAEVKNLIDDLGCEQFEAYRDVTVTGSEWARATGNGLPNPAGGIADRFAGASQPSYSSGRAAVGMVALALGALAVRRSTTRS